MTSVGEDTGTVPPGSVEQWRDKKRYLWLIGLVVPSLAFVALGLHELTGWRVWFWIGPVVVLAIVPAIDLLTGLDRSNPPDDVIEALEEDRYYRWITYLFLPVQYAGFLAVFWLIGTGDLAVVDKVGLALSIGTICARSSARRSTSTTGRSTCSSGSCTGPPTARS